MQLLDKWEDELDFSHDMISLAADMAFEAKKPVSYMDKLLTTWAEKNIRTPEEAKKRLQDIYDRMETEHRCIPAEWLEKPEEYNTFAKYRDGLTRQKSPWQYFEKKDLFNLDKDVGFHEESFSDEWKCATDAQNRLFWNVEK